MDNKFSQLTARQIQILKAVIEEYISTAEAVGSETLEKKYNLGVSPATIRNEMVKLTKMNLLKQPHTSSGRAPTPDSLKFYVENLMKQKALSVADEVSVKERVWDYRQKQDKLLREATRTLAEKTHSLALSATQEGDLFYSGAGNILESPEFNDVEIIHHLLNSLEHHDFWWNLLERHDEPFYIAIGDDFAEGSLLSECSFVYAKFSTPRLTGGIGVVGPFRLDYPSIIPTVRYIGSLVSELTQW